MHFIAAGVFEEQGKMSSLLLLIKLLLLSPRVNVMSAPTYISLTKVGNLLYGSWSFKN